MDFKIALACSLGALLSLPQWAMAGPLARTGRAIDNKSSGSSGSSGSSSDREAQRDHPQRDDSRGNYRTSSTTTYVSGTSASCIGCTTEATPLHIPVPAFEFGLAAQKVRGSDGSFRLDASMLFGRLGLYTRGDYYFEEISAASDPKSMEEARSEHVRVNLFELALLGRLVDAEDFQADLHAGLGVAASSVFATLPGSAVGITMQARVSEVLSLRAEGRAMALKHSTRALEGATGIQWRELWLGYRALQFDVGEVLQGPEAGVRFRF